MQVTPEVKDDAVLCPCGEPMVSVHYRDLETGGYWHWWACAAGHVTGALPLPRQQPAGAV